MLGTIIEGYRWVFLRLADALGFGWGIVALSFITSALMAPLIRAVGCIVRRETEYQSVLLPQIAEIKRNYSSDMERTLHIQLLYSRYGYSPLSAVKKVLPLFVQIPFLLITYYMLKGTPQLHCVSFGIIKDLGVPDALLTAIGHFPLGLNLLPFVMTGINLLTVLGTPSFTSKDQLNAATISLLFLLLLYTAPSALLLYWTLNNAITFLKTVLPDHAKGLRLILNRIALLRDAPSACLRAMTPIVLSYFSLALLIMALYMRLMVLMEVWWFNYMASYWLMCIVLTALIWTTYYSNRNVIQGKRIVGVIILGISGVISATLFISVVSLAVTTKLLKLITNNVDLKLYFTILFLLWLALIILEYRKEWIESLKDIKTAFCGNAIWLLLPVVIGIHYSFSSANFKLPLGSVIILCLYLFIPVIILVTFSIWAFRRHISADETFKIIVGACSGAYLVPMISRETGKLLGYGSNLVIRLCFLFAVAFVLTRFRKRKTAVLFVSLLSVMVLVNVAWTKCRGDKQNTANVTHVASEAEMVFEKLKCVRKNNVYLLVYDSYAHDIVLDALRIPHADLPSILKERGFTRYDAYSTGSDTVASMSSAFSIGGIVQGSPRSMLAGNNVLNDVLQRSGYRTSYVLCGYEMPGRGERMPGDSYFPSPMQITRPELVLYPCILRGILSQSANTFNSYTPQEWGEWKRKEIAEMGQGMNFLYAHSQYPGHCVANPMYRKSDMTEWQNYAKRVALADAEMKEDLDLIFSKEKDPFIIIASDHGAYLTLPKGEVGSFNAADLLDRCGIQLFVRWPNGYMPTMQIDILSNVFLETLICLTGDISLANFKSSGETLPFQYPLKAPAGAVKNATIQSGPLKGQNIFEAAKRDFQLQQSH